MTEAGVGFWNFQLQFRIKASQKVFVLDPLQSALLVSRLWNRDSLKVLNESPRSSWGILGYQKYCNGSIENEQKTNRWLLLATLKINWHIRFIENV